MMGVEPLVPGDPRRLNDYKLVGRLGSGGMGTVFLAKGGGGALVAIKLLRPELAESADFRRRFAREAASLALVRAGCTAAVLDARVDSSTPYLVTEYIQGPTLMEYLSANGPMDPGMLRGFAVGLASALTAIHDAGIVHRDLKPANIILSKDGPKVVDFGIAHTADATMLTRTGTVLGSPGFMAPEQITDSAGPAADVFAWALNVAYAATGRLPFGIGPSEAVLYRIIHHEPDLTGVPEQALPLLKASLAKNPLLRPTADQLLADLLDTGGRLERSELFTATTMLLTRTWTAPPTVKPPGHPSRPPHRRNRRLTIATAIAAASVTALIGTVIVSLGGTTNDAPSTPASTTTAAQREAPLSAPSVKIVTPSPVTLPRTKVLTYQPWTVKGVSPTVTVTEKVTGSCWSAAMSSGRDDSYRCDSPTARRIYDPCFKSPFEHPPTRVVCPSDDPQHAVLLKLTQDLPEAENLDPIPWLIVLADGQRCTAVTGTSVMAAGKRGSYLCPRGGLYGDPGQGTTWTISYQADGESTLTTVPITTVYQ